MSYKVHVHLNDMNYTGSNIAFPKSDFCDHLVVSIILTNKYNSWK